MGTLDFFRMLTNTLHFATWSKEEQLSLLRILDDLYRSDNDDARAEVQDFRRKLMVSNVQAEEVEELEIDEAMEILHADQTKQELLYIILAAAVFRDGKFAGEERSFLNELVQKHQLDSQKLEIRLSEQKSRHIEEILKDWNLEIQNRDFAS